MSERVRIACVQYPQRRADGFDAFAAQVEDYVRVAADYDCDQVLLPEPFTRQLLSADRRPDLYRQWADCAPNAL
ncbi:MAG: hypothetical protein WCZ65_00130 [Lysobacteraceae bacterium]